MTTKEGWLLFYPFPIRMLGRESFLKALSPFTLPLHWNSQDTDTWLSSSSSFLDSLCQLPADQCLAGGRRQPDRGGEEALLPGDPYLRQPAPGTLRWAHTHHVHSRHGRNSQLFVLIDAGRKLKASNCTMKKPRVLVWLSQLLRDLPTKLVKHVNSGYFFLPRLMNIRLVPRSLCFCLLHCQAWQLHKELAREQKDWHPG